MRKNLRGRKATAIALASVMAMSLAACGFPLRIVGTAVALIVAAAD